MPHLSRALAVLTALVLAASCGDDPPLPRPPVPKALPGTPPEVEQALLTEDELGDDWHDEGPTPFEERGLPECPQNTALTAGKDEHRLGEAQTYFVEGDGRQDRFLPTFFESVSLWTSEQVARERVAQFASQTTDCRSFRRTAPNGERAEISVAERPAPQLGEQVAGVRVRVEQERGVQLLDLIAVRVGDAVVLTLGERVEGEGLEPERLDRLTAQAVDKAQRRLAEGVTPTGTATPTPG